MASKTENQARYIEQEGLPASIEAERAVLGAIILNNVCINQAASRLQESDFALDSHQRIYRAMLELVDHGGKIDFVTLTERLKIEKLLAFVGGDSYVTGLTDGLPRYSNIEHYVEIVREKARARMLLNLFTSGAGRIRAMDDPDEVLAEVQNDLLGIIHHGRIGKSLTVKEITLETLEELHTIRRMQGGCVGLTTGLDDLDELTTGFRDSEFYVIGARPGQGKTAFACQAIRKNCKAGRKCSFFSVEVIRTQIITRLIAQESKVSIFDMRDPRVLSEGQLNKINLAAAEVSEWPLLIEDSPRMDIKQLQAIARLHISQGAEIIFVDYLQKLRAPGRDRFEKVTAIADALWELGRSTNVPVVALSQLKRKLNPNEEPTMDDLRESGEIEQNANGVFLLHRPKDVDEQGKKFFTGLDKIIIGKQRSGPAERSISVQFEGAIGMFRPRMVSANG